MAKEWLKFLIGARGRGGFQTRPSVRLLRALGGEIFNPQTNDRMRKTLIKRRTFCHIFRTAFLGVLFSLPLDAQTPAPIVRPRMLLSENDPLTGLKILRARYEDGQRPANDLAGRALAYLITKDESFARRAVEEMRQTRPPALVSSRTYPDYLRWSLAYDWLYNYRGFAPDLKDRVARELFAAAEKLLDSPALREPENVMYHNYDVRHLTLATFALTAIEGHPGTESRAAPLRRRAARAFDNILDVSQFVTPDGGYHESMDYQRITFVPLALMAELRRTVTNADPSYNYTLYRHYTDTYLYKVLPDGTTARDDDNEFPFLKREDNTVLGYAVNRFKDPYAAWMLRRSEWPSTAEWMVPVTEFLWNDLQVAPRDPNLAGEAELPRHYLFRGIGHLVMRSGWGPDATWISFNSGPYFGKHDHLDQNHFTIYHKGYLATESGADYTDTESPHYLNYYRRTVAHNSMLIYRPGEKFFWGESLWDAANDGGQRMDSSRYWNSVRNRGDFERTRDLWATGEMERTDYVPGAYSYARGNATRAYQPSKLEHFTRELCYTPDDDVLVIFDRVRSVDAQFKKAWLLHGVGEPEVKAFAAPRDVGHGGRAYANAPSFVIRNGGGVLRVHSLLPREREVVKRGGPDWEFWTPGDERGGAWGSGVNWPQDPPEGGPLPSDPYLRKMWKTFWGQDFERLLPSNSRAVVPAAWRVEVSPANPAKEDLFLHVCEIKDAGDSRAPRVELLDGHHLVGAVVEGGTISLFAKDESFVTNGEVTIPNVAAKALLVSGLRPHAKYEMIFTQLGNGRWNYAGDANEKGVLYVPFAGQKDGRLRLRLLSGE